MAASLRQSQSLPSGVRQSRGKSRGAASGHDVAGDGRSGRSRERRAKTGGGQQLAATWSSPTDELAFLESGGGGGGGGYGGPSELEKEWALLQWRKSDVESRLQTVLTESKRQIESQDLLKYARAPARAAEKAEWVRSIIKSELQKPIGVALALGRAAPGAVDPRREAAKQAAAEEAELRRLEALRKLEARLAAQAWHHEERHSPEPSGGPVAARGRPGTMDAYGRRSARGASPQFAESPDYAPIPSTAPVSAGRGGRRVLPESPHSSPKSPASRSPSPARSPSRSRSRSRSPSPSAPARQRVVLPEIIADPNLKARLDAVKQLKAEVRRRQRTTKPQSNRFPTSVASR